MCAEACPRTPLPSTSAIKRQINSTLNNTGRRHFNELREPLGKSTWIRVRRLSGSPLCLWATCLPFISPSLNSCSCCWYNEIATHLKQEHVTENLSETVYSLRSLRAIWIYNLYLENIMEAEQRRDLTQQTLRSHPDYTLLRSPPVCQTSPTFVSGNLRLTSILSGPHEAAALPKVARLCVALTSRMEGNAIYRRGQLSIAWDRWDPGLRDLLFTMTTRETGLRKQTRGKTSSFTRLEGIKHARGGEKDKEETPEHLEWRSDSWEREGEIQMRDVISSGLGFISGVMIRITFGRL